MSLNIKDLFGSKAAGGLKMATCDLVTLKSICSHVSLEDKMEYAEVGPGAAATMRRLSPADVSIKLSTDMSLDANAKIVVQFHIEFECAEPMPDVEEWIAFFYGPRPDRFARRTQKQNPLEQALARLTRLATVINMTDVEINLSPELNMPVRMLTYYDIAKLFFKIDELTVLGADENIVQTMLMIFNSEKQSYKNTLRAVRTIRCEADNDHIVNLLATGDSFKNGKYFNFKRRPTCNVIEIAGEGTIDVLKYWQPHCREAAVLNTLDLHSQIEVSYDTAIHIGIKLVSAFKASSFAGIVRCKRGELDRLFHHHQTMNSNIIQMQYSVQNHADGTDQLYVTWQTEDIF